VDGPEELLGRGREADIVAWEDGRVLKLYISPARRDDAEHEARLTTAIHAAGVPAPRCFGTVTHGDRTGLVLERLDGPLFVEAVLDPHRSRTELARLAELQAQIQSHRIGGLPQLHARMARRIQRARPYAAELADSALEQLARLPEDDCLCHWDLHPGNVIATNNGLKVIDWSGAAAGNPLADTARTLFLLADAPLMNDAPPELVHRVAEVRTGGLASYLDRYCSITGATLEGLQAWRLPVLVDRLADGIPEERDLILRLADQAWTCGLRCSGQHS
jgi:aminoglycoside phosphotransferase (APT) family kinase protein